MEITVNGKREMLDFGCTLASYLQARGFRQERIVVEYNGELLARELWKDRVLKPEDRMEIVTFVGGG